MTLKPRHRSVLELALLLLVVGGVQQWWVARSLGDLGDQLAAQAQRGDIRMLASQTCSVCAAARAWFTAHQVAFTECTIEQDAKCKADFEVSRASGTPLMLVRGQPQVGFSPERLLAALRPVPPR